MASSGSSKPFSLADLGRSSFVSQRGLADTLKRLQDAGKLVDMDATSRASIKRAREREHGIHDHSVWAHLCREDSTQRKQKEVICMSHSESSVVVVLLGGNSTWVEPSLGVHSDTKACYQSRALEADSLL